MFPQKPQKSLEEVIRELAQKNKNKPSPLSETYNRSNQNVHAIKSKISYEPNRDAILGGFKPTAKKFGTPL